MIPASTSGACRWRCSSSTSTSADPSLLILTSLADGPRHGYGVIQEVASLSSGRVTLRPGTLYGALDRLVGEAEMTKKAEVYLKPS